MITQSAEALKTLPEGEEFEEAKNAIHESMKLMIDELCNLKKDYFIC